MTSLFPSAHDHLQPCYTVNPRDGHPHTHTIIFLHGRDSTAEEFASELFESEASPLLAYGVEDGPPPRISRGRTLPDLLPSIKWVFPSAPILRSTRFNTDMSQWFDIWCVEDPSLKPEIQIPGLRKSITYIQSVIDTEANYLDLVVPGDGGGGGGRSKIFLGGISQGFAAALATFYATPPPNPMKNTTTTTTTNKEQRRNLALAGLIGIATWMPFAQIIRDICRWTRQDMEVEATTLEPMRLNGGGETEWRCQTTILQRVGKFYSGFPGLSAAENRDTEEPDADGGHHHPTTIHNRKIYDAILDDEITTCRELQQDQPDQQEEEEKELENEKKQKKLMLSTREMEILETPIHLQHCEDDEIVPVTHFREMGMVLGADEFMKALVVHSKTYSTGGHWVNEPMGIDDLVLFINGICNQG